MVSVPKYLFIDRLIEMVGNDKNELEILRHELLMLCKNKAEFVYKTAQLKCRYEARRRTGESMTNKLAKDCFILFRSSQGDVNEDVFDVLNITKSQPLPKPGHDEQCSREAQCNTPGIALRESLAIIERDLITLRGELVQDIDCCRTKIDTQAKQHVTLKSEMLDLRQQLQQQKEMYVKTQNENQQLKEKVATLQKHLKKISSNNKTVLKETLGEFTKMYEQNKNIKSDVDKNTTEIKSHMQAFDDVKRTLVSLKQLEKTVGKSKMSHENLHKEFTCFKSKVDNGCLNISRLYDEKCMGVSAIKSKVQITNTKVKNIEESLVELTALIKSVTTSTTDMRKRVTSLEKELKHYSTKKSYSEAIVSNNSSETSITRTVNNDKMSTQSEYGTSHVSDTFPVAGSDDNPGTTDINSRQRREKQQPASSPNPIVLPASDAATKCETTSVIHNTSRNVDPPPVSHHTRRDSSPEARPSRPENIVACNTEHDTTVTKNTQQVPSDGPRLRDSNISVWAPSDQCGATLSTQSVFRGVSKHKVARYYVGGIDKRSTEAGLRDFLTKNGVKLTFVRFFNRENRKTASAQINVILEHRDIVEREEFWPYGLFIKQWLPKQKFLIQFNNNNDNGSVNN